MSNPNFETVHFEAAGNQLTGRLTLPDRPGPHPTVVFVHGSGSSMRDGRGGFIPLFEEFSSRGVASLSWDKPGVGESNGNWRFQTFDDRAREVQDAIEYLKTRDDIDSSKIGMWGISQAGWVMPKVCANCTNVAFVIAVSVPVGTVAEQDLFRVKHAMYADGYSAEEVEQALGVVHRLWDMLKKNVQFGEMLGLYEEYKGQRWAHFMATEPEPTMYQFARAIAASDAPPDVTSIKCPVLAVFGEKDMLVDVTESSEHYARVLSSEGNGDVTVRIIPNANHGIALAKTGGQEEADRMRESGNWRHASGYLELMGEWLEKRVGRSS